MIYANDADLKEAQNSENLRSRCKDVSITVTEVESEVGGGTLPDVVIPSYGIGLKPHKMPETFLKKLQVHDSVSAKFEKNVS